MQIVSLGDKFHEMLSPIFLGIRRKLPAVSCLLKLPRECLIFNWFTNKDSPDKPSYKHSLIKAVTVYTLIYIFDFCSAAN